MFRFFFFNFFSCSSGWITSIDLQARTLSSINSALLLSPSSFLIQYFLSSKFFILLFFSSKMSIWLSFYFPLKASSFPCLSSVFSFPHGTHVCFEACLMTPVSRSYWFWHMLIMFSIGVKIWTYFLDFWSICVTLKHIWTLWILYFINTESCYPLENADVFVLSITNCLDPHFKFHLTICGH